MKPGKHQRSKQSCQDLYWKVTTVHNLLFCVHTLCMNHVTNTFLLVSSSVRSKQLLCFVHGQGQKREQKHKTKNLVRLHNHSPLLTMAQMATSSSIHTVMCHPLYKKLFIFIVIFLFIKMVCFSVYCRYIQKCALLLYLRAKFVNSPFCS